MYLGPDTALPLASAVAAVVGVAVMFWNRTVAAVKRIFGVFGRKDRRTQGGKDAKP